MFRKAVMKFLVCIVGLMGFYASEVFAQANANVNVQANVPKVCRFISTTASFSISHGGTNIDQTATVDATGSTNLTYRCSNQIVPLFSIDGGTAATSPSASVVLSDGGTNNMTATVSVTGATAGTGLGGGQDKTATVGGTISQANFQNVSPALYGKTVVIGISAQ